VDVATFDGVTDVAFEASQMRVEYASPENKAAVIHRLVESDAKVLDFETEEATLGDLFSAFTETVDDAVTQVATDGGVAPTGVRR
jgi:ABC-2 type transport system ATP-binding protein